MKLVLLQIEEYTKLGIHPYWKTLTKKSTASGNNLKELMKAE